MKVFLPSRALLILSILCLLQLSVFGFFQNSISKAKTKYEFTDTRISAADSLLKNRKYQEALEAYQIAYDIFESESFYEGMVYTKERMGYAFRRSGINDLSSASFEEAIALAKESLSPEHMLLAKAYLNNGVREHRRDKFFLGSRLLDSASMTYQKSSSYDSSVYEQIVNYKFYTYLYSNLNADTLVKYLNERGRLLDSRVADLDETVYLFSDYSRAYYQTGDYQKAVAYALEAVRFAENGGEGLTPFYYSDALFNLGRSLNSLRELERALSVANKLIEFTLEKQPSSSFLLGYYNLKAVILNGLERYAEAADEFQRIIETMENRNQNTLFYRSSVMNLGVCYQLMGNYTRAEYYLFKALKEERKAQQDYSVSMSDRYEYLGQLYKSKGEFDQALLYYDSALRSNVLGYRESNILDYPEEGELNGTYEILNIIKNKQICMNKLYGAIKNDSSELLISSIEYTERTHRYLIKNRSDLEVSKGKLFLSENFKSLYESGIESAYWMYRRNEGESKYFSKAFSFFGFSKSLLFLEQSGELGRALDKRLSKDFRNRYFSLKQEVEQLEEKFNLLIDEVANSDSLRIVNANLMTKASKLKNLSDSISYVLGDQSQFDLSRDEQFNFLKTYASGDRAILEYFVGEEAIFVFGVFNDKKVFERIDLEEEFRSSFTQLISAISKRPKIRDYHVNFESYKSTAHFLYTLLLEKAMDIFGPDVLRLTIVPDEQLSKLPFEILLVSDKAQTDSYRDLDYVIQHLRINYFLSSMEATGAISEKRAKKSLFGIGYSESSNLRLRSSFGALPGTEREIRYLESNISGDYFFGPDGTKETFLSEARNYDVLHLAVHGQSDSTNRYLSSLVFNGENSVLKTNDLYAAGLTARLAVLSACESGVGQINKGEGTFSIARGFALVGVPSIVMSLWKVNDKLASELMVEFHRRLQNGQSVNVALTESKKLFLINSDKYTSHPYYWSAFVSLGKEVVIEEKTYNVKTWHLLVGFILVVIVLYFNSTNIAVALKKKRGHL